MSTNDMVAVLANGAAKNKLINKTGTDFDKFTHGLTHVCVELAKMIVRDGEGASKFIEIEVAGAPSEKQARAIGLAVANSVLVKTAAFGNNPNWGRVAAAAGSLGIARVTEENLKITFSPFDKKHIKIHIDLNAGKHKAVIYTCDLSYEYVKINVEYT
jgi:glutamate N-acetyltransferase/amino-acid N-acetyltransferase